MSGDDTQDLNEMCSNSGHMLKTWSHEVKHPQNSKANIMENAMDMVSLNPFNVNGKPYFSNLMKY